MKTDPDTLVQQFLDGDLRGEEEAAALRRIAEDREARAFLRFDARLRRALDEEMPAEVPAGFADRVMQAVAEVEGAGEPSSPIRARLKRFWKLLIQPRPIHWRPAYALPMLLLVIGLLYVLPDREASPPGPETPVETASLEEASDEDAPVLVRFTFADEEAGSVAVAGDFNYWEPEPLTPQEAGGRVVWSALMAVPPGEHRYMFVVDGEEWVADPMATELRDDGFGKTNAVLSL